MPYVINIFNIKTNVMNANANFDIGPTVQNSHTSNNKYVGSNNTFGDVSASFSAQANGNFDADVSDQGQVANPSAPIAPQF
ncbi:MAG: spore germination protein [Tuberibacillus sp.]